jgi:hypothetical protein
MCRIAGLVGCAEEPTLRAMAAAIDDAYLVLALLLIWAICQPLS